MPDRSASDLFQATLYRFTPGVRAGETAMIANGDGTPILTYRSFATIVGIVATLVAGIVFVAGIAATLFLYAEERPAAAGAALFLTLAFTTLIAAFVPRIRVTLYDTAGKPALKIVQQSRVPFPSTRFAVRSADGVTLAVLRRIAISRLFAHRWTIAAPPDQTGVAYAAEESLGKAFKRKFLGKFNRKYQTNLRVIHNGMEAATIVRRPTESGEYDVLQIVPDAPLDRRVTVALATLVFGAEP